MSTTNRQEKESTPLYAFQFNTEKKAVPIPPGLLSAKRIPLNTLKVKEPQDGGVDSDMMGTGNEWAVAYDASCYPPLLFFYNGKPMQYELTPETTPIGSEFNASVDSICYDQGFSFTLRGKCPVPAEVGPIFVGPLQAMNFDDSEGIQVRSKERMVVKQQSSMGSLVDIVLRYKCYEKNIKCNDS